jgi:excisionase family DNA binding protein
MTQEQTQFLTTRELADMLRIGERKVYDMAAQGEVPCVKAMGKLLFPRAEIIAWLDQSRVGPKVAPVTAIPNIIAGSHDPLIAQALEQSGAGLAAYFDGSLDGLERIKTRQAAMALVHIQDDEGWNTKTVSQELGEAAVVLVEFAKRERGILVPVGNPRGIKGIKDLDGLSMAHRQENAAGQQMLLSLCQKERVTPVFAEATLCRSETALATMVAEDKVEAAFGLYHTAVENRCDFIPILEERLDFLLWRHAWFEPPFLALWGYLGSEHFIAQSARTTGYDFSGMGTIHFNGRA